MGMLRILSLVYSWRSPRWRSRLLMVWDAHHSAEEIRALDISIGPTGDELPPGRGTPKEGAQIYRAKCSGCHGATGIEGKAPILKSKAAPDVELWRRGRILPLRSPFATTVWDYINRAMPLNREGTLTADEVYSLTAFLLYINDVIPEEVVLDAQSLPKVKIPIGDKYALLPEWKPRTPRLKATRIRSSFHPVNRMSSTTFC